MIDISKFNTHRTLFNVSHVSLIFSKSSHILLDWTENIFVLPQKYAFGCTYILT